MALNLKSQPSLSAIKAMAFKLLNLRLHRNEMERKDEELSESISTPHINDNKTFGHNGLYVFSSSCVDG